LFKSSLENISELLDIFRECGASHLTKCHRGRGSGTV
jgi:hypothetical protein